MDKETRPYIAWDVCAGFYGKGISQNSEFLRLMPRSVLKF